MQNQEFRRQNPRKSPDAGNALWFILIAIALLAALTLTLTRNSSKMSSNLNSEQSRVVAEQTLRSFNTYRAAVEKLITRNGCSENEISFENSVTGSPDFVNPTAPPDKHCHVFEPEGAGMVPLAIPGGITTAPATYWGFTGNVAVSGVGPESTTETTCSAKCAELLILQSGVTAEFCTQYNMLIGLNGGTAPLGANAVTYAKFAGSYDEGTASSKLLRTGTGDKATALYNKETGCYRTGSSLNPVYSIYYTLIAR